METSGAHSTRFICGEMDGRRGREGFKIPRTSCGNLYSFIVYKIINRKVNLNPVNKWLNVVLDLPCEEQFSPSSSFTFSSSFKSITTSMESETKLTTTRQVIPIIQHRYLQLVHRYYRLLPCEGKTPVGSGSTFTTTMGSVEKQNLL